MTVRTPCVLRRAGVRSEVPEEPAPAKAGGAFAFGGKAPAERGSALQPRAAWLLPFSRLRGNKGPAPAKAGGPDGRMGGALALGCL